MHVNIYQTKEKTLKFWAKYFPCSAKSCLCLHTLNQTGSVGTFHTQCERSLWIPDWSKFSFTLSTNTLTESVLWGRRECLEYTDN